MSASGHHLDQSPHTSPRQIFAPAMALGRCSGCFISRAGHQRLLAGKPSAWRTLGRLGCHLRFHSSFFTCTLIMCRGRCHGNYKSRDFFAPFVAVVTLLKGYFYMVRSHRHAFFHRSQKGHVVICGLGQKGLHLARDYRQRAAGWLLLKRTGKMNSCPSASGSTFITSLVTPPSLLCSKKPGPHRREMWSWLRRMMETNLRIAVQLCGLVGKSGGGAPRCFVHLKNIQLATLKSLQKHFERKNRDGCPVQFFDVHDCEGEGVFCRNCLLMVKGFKRRTRTRVHMKI